MKQISIIALKSISFGLINVAGFLLFKHLFWTTGQDLTAALGIVVGIVNAVIVWKSKAIISAAVIVLGLTASAVLDRITVNLGINSKIIMDALKHDEYVREMGRLSLQHNLSGVGSSFLYLLSSIITFVLAKIFISFVVKKKSIEIETMEDSS